MDRAPRYEEDFYAWSQHQAQVLRALGDRVALPNELDLAHLVEEVEDLGRSELNGVLGHLEGMLMHLAKAASSPEALPARKWLVEVDEHQSHARRGFTPSMRRQIDLNGLWRRALKRAETQLSLYDERLADLSATCPFTLDELLSEDPNAAALAARLRPPPAA
ncbi:DUF29 domain-containing protein [Roseicella aquatilis]|nr:DUF29 domain-containing protein [Roseicella aquatilis]